MHYLGKLFYAHNQSQLVNTIKNLHMSNISDKLKSSY